MHDDILKYFIKICTHLGCHFLQEVLPTPAHFSVPDHTISIFDLDLDYLKARTKFQIIQYVSWKWLKIVA